MKRNLFFVLMLLPVLVFSQNRIGKVADEIVTQKIKPGKFQAYELFDSGFKKASGTYKDAVREGIVLDFSASKVAQLVNKNPKDISLTLPINERGETVTLELLQKDIYASSFSVRTSDGRDITNTMDRGKHYQGIVAGKPHSLVGISIFNNEVMGFITMGDGNYVIGRLQDSNSKHIIYNDRDLLLQTPFNCEMPDDGVGYTAEQLQAPLNRDPGDVVCIYVEAGQSVFNSFGGNLTNTTNFLNGVFAQSYVLYANEGIAMQTSEMFIWTTVDPYNSGTTGGQLGTFQAQTSSINGNLGHLVEVQNIGGLAAGFSGICNANVDNSLCFSGFSGNGFNTVPTFSFNVMIITHEMGHLLGSRHTHACVWNGNNTAIDTCSGFTEGGCPLVGSPPGGGTIMSYCHNDPVGVDFTQGFGPQPGAVVLNTVNTPGNCLIGSCSAAPANDLCANAQPMNCGDTVSGDTSMATLDSVGFCGTSNTAPGVWYSFTGFDGQATLSTCNQAAYDTKISVFSGSCGGLVCVGGNDDGPGCAGFTSLLNVCVEAGETYYVLVHGFGSAVGTFNLTLTCTPSTVAITCPPTINVEGCGPGDAPAPYATIAAFQAAGGTVTGATSISMTNQSVSGSCPYTITRTYEVTDACGFTATCDQTIIVDDTTAPTITCPLDTTVECSPPGIITVTGTDTASYTGANLSWSDSTTGVVATPTANLIGIPAGATVTDVNVNFDIDHSWVGDLEVTLISPDGTSVPIMFDPVCPVSGNSDNVRATFDDSAPTGVNGNCTSVSTTGPHESCPGDYLANAAVVGPFQPNSPLSALNGENAAGVWTLSILDDAGGDGGCLHDFSVEVSWTAQVVGDNTDPANTGFATASDNCTATITYSDASVAGCGNTQVITRTWTATDDCGNATSCDQIITVVDTTPPTVTNCPTNISVNNDAGVCGAVVNYTAVTGTDTCGGVTVNQTAGLASGSVFPVGTTTNTFEVVDDCGNISICTFDVTVTDNEAPNAVCQNITVQLDASGNGSIVATDVDGGSTDNCAIATLSVAPDTFDCSNVGPNNVLLTVTDIYGNSSTCTAIVTVEDNVPPVVSCPANIQANNDTGICGAAVTYAPAIAADACGIASVVQTSPDPAVLGSGDVFPVGTTTVTFTATDVNGNTNTCSFDIIVTDNEPPAVACQDITVELDANGDYNLTTGEVIASVSDNCGVATIGFADPLNSDFTECGPSGLPIPATGTSGPMDPSPAVVTTVGTVGVDYAIERVDLDLNHTFDGDLNITLTSPNGLVLDLSSGNGGSGDNYTNTVFMDGAPSITTGAAPFTGTFQPEGGPMNGFFAGEPVNGNWTLNITDLFGGDSGVLNNYCITFTSLAPATVPSIDLTCANVGTNTFTVVVTDVNGNTSTCETEVTVEDNTAPVIACIGEPTPVTDSASASPNLPINAGTPTVVSTIDVTDDFIITDLDVDVDIPHAWVGDLIVQIESPSGTVVTIIDQPGVPATTFGCAGDDILATLDDEATDPVEDECDAGVPTINGSFIPNNPLSVFDGESTLGTWTLTVIDTFPAGDDGVFSAWGISYTHDVTSAPYDAILDGTTGTVTVNAADLLLNVDEACGYTVSFGVAGSPINECGDGLPAAIDDNLPPTESTATIAESGIVGTDYAIESVTLDITHTFDGDLDIELVSPTGTVLMLSDQNGGSGDNYTGTVFQDGGADITAASAPFTGTFEPQGGTFAATFGGEQINGGWVLRVTDNFGGDVGTLDTYCINFTPLATSTIEFDCSQLGLNQVDVTVTDPSGNSATCTATVNVIDNTDPILVCMDATVELDENGMAEVTPDLFIDTVNSFDACGITITAVDVTDVTCDDIGTAITVTVFASDASGNLASCTATLTVVDLLGPTIESCPEDQTVDPGPLNLFYELPDYWALGGITAVDNCTDPVTIFSQNPPAGTLLPDGTYTIAICATDEYGNEGCCTFQLTVESLLGNENIGSDISTIVIYPNPAKATVNISNPQSIDLQSASIYDLTGKLVRTYDLRGMGTEKALNISMLASATYLVYIQAENGSITKQLIKE